MVRLAFFGLAVLALAGSALVFPPPAAHEASATHVPCTGPNEEWTCGEKCVANCPDEGRGYWDGFAGFLPFLIGGVLVMVVIFSVKANHAKKLAAKPPAPQQAVQVKKEPDTAMGEWKGLDLESQRQRAKDTGAWGATSRSLWTASTPSTPNAGWKNVDAAAPAGDDLLDAAISENPAAQAVKEFMGDIGNKMSEGVTALVTGQPIEGPDLGDVSNKLLRGFMDAGKANLEKITGNPMGGKTYELGSKLFEHMGDPNPPQLPTGDQFVDGTEKVAKAVFKEDIVDPVKETIMKGLKPGDTSGLRLPFSDGGFQSSGYEPCRTDYWFKTLGPR